MKIDLIDRKILFQLDQNCRKSLLQIAKEIRIHRNVALYRIKNLEKAGIIRGYFTEIDVNKLGYISCRVFLKLGNYSKEEEVKLLNYLKKIKQLMWLFQVQGKWDLDIIFAAETLKEFDDFLLNLTNKFNKIIEEKNISIMAQILSYPKDYLISKKRELKYLEEPVQSKIKIDKIDKLILQILSNKANIPFIDLVEKVNISINTLKERLKKLERNKIILSYRTFIDTEKTGYQYFKIIIFLKNYHLNDLNRIKSFFENNEKLIYLTKYINGGDIEAEMHLENDGEFQLIKERLIENFGEKIKEIIVLKFYKEHIYKYLPEIL